MHAFLAGMLAWSLAEYLVHRFVLHRKGGPFWPEHRKHHRDPFAETGFPVSYVAWGFAGVACFCTALFGLLSLAFFAGAFGGYLAYVTLHEGMHRWKIEKGNFLYPSKVRHDLHHRGVRANYGITSPLWDILFFTYRGA